MRHLFTSLALAAVIVPCTLTAQSSSALAPAAPAPSVTTVAASPQPAGMIRSDVAGINTQSDSKAPLVVSSAAAEGLHQGEGIALMAVGGAGLVAGLLIGGNAGSAVAIGGLAVGLVGLYEYVR